jgi:putative flippase GtrA
MGLRMQFAKFGITGLITTFIFVAVSYLGELKLGFGTMTSNLIGWLASVTFSFVVNCAWVFYYKAGVAVFGRFMAVAFSSLCLVTTASYASAYLGFEHWISIAVIVAVISTMNFFIHSLWTFRY